MDDDLCKNLDKNEFVNVHKMCPENFHDHQEWQDTMYWQPTAGEFKQSHAFTISNHGMHKQRPACTTIIKQDCNDSNKSYDSLVLIRKANRLAEVYSKEERARRIKNMQADLKQLVPSGLRPIKQVELYTKWAKFLPRWATKITCQNHLKR